MPVLAQPALLTNQPPKLADPKPATAQNAYPNPQFNPGSAFPMAKDLAWDSRIKEVTVSNGVQSAAFTYSVTNIGKSNVVILDTVASCECTVANLPSKPWVLPPGSNGQIQVTVNLEGKSGNLNKYVQLVISNQPMDSIVSRVNILPPPPMSEDERANNRRISVADAQNIFRGSCTRCHVEPSRGRTGEMLYTTLCGVCHEAAPDRRASMVPNLHDLKKPTNYGFWTNIITSGKTNSLMPAFADSNGGPLNQTQINSLAQYLAVAISRDFSVLRIEPGPPPLTGHKPLPTNKPGASVPPTLVPLRPRPPIPTNSVPN